MSKIIRRATKVISEKLPTELRGSYARSGCALSDPLCPAASFECLSSDLLNPHHLDGYSAAEFEILSGWALFPALQNDMPLRRRR